MFVPAPNIVQIEMVYQQHSQSMENVFHVKCNNGFELADLGNLITVFDSWHNGLLKAQQHSSAALRLIVARHLISPNGPSQEWVINPVRAGTAGTSSMPGNVTAVVTWSTALRGRSYRGRTFHIGVATGHVLGNQLAAAYVTNYVNAYQQLRTILATWSGRYDLVVLSKRENNQWRSEAVATVVTGLSVEGNLDSQRRRLTGPGRGV